MVGGVVAFVPLRGGSKAIPHKNIKFMAGRPLAYWAISAADQCSQIDKVVVSTDSEAIKDALRGLFSPKVVFFDRAPETATDTASTESALLEYFDSHPCETVVLLQATSPLTRTSDLEKGLVRYRSEKYDSILSAVNQKRFYWKNEISEAAPLNYDYRARPRRQDFDGFFVENGAFYITSHKALVESRNRLSGKIGIVEMDESTLIEIDSPSDWAPVEAEVTKALRSKLGLVGIKLVVTDVDGVLTDGGMYYSKDGEVMKKFNTRDGMGFELLRKSGIKTAILTSEDSDIVKKRAAKIKADFVQVGIKNKLPVFESICREAGVTFEQALYLGDDLNDLECLKRAGVSACPSNAEMEIKKYSKHICSRAGGEGVFREITNLILGLA